MKSKLSESIALAALAATVFLLAAAACGGNDAGQSGAAQGAGAPALPTGTPAPSANETVPNEIEAAAQKLLADELGVDEGGFRLVNSERVGWPDASLGCPQEGYAYAQVLTPGYKLVFDYGGTSHAVHTNSDGSHMVNCGGGQ